MGGWSRAEHALAPKEDSDDLVLTLGSYVTAYWVLVLYDLDPSGLVPLVNQVGWLERHDLSFSLFFPRPPPKAAAGKKRGK